MTCSRNSAPPAPCAKAISCCRRGCTARCSCRRTWSSWTPGAASGCARRWREIDGPARSGRRRRLAGRGRDHPGLRDRAPARACPRSTSSGEGGAFKLRRGFRARARARRVVMVEDIVTTGLSSRECIARSRRRAARSSAPPASSTARRRPGRRGRAAGRAGPASTCRPIPPTLPPEPAAVPDRGPGSRRLGRRAGCGAAAAGRQHRPRRHHPQRPRRRHIPAAVRRAAIEPLGRRARTALPPTCARTGGTSPTPTSTRPGTPHRSAGAGR